MYAVNEGGGWLRETVDDAGLVGQYTSMAIDAAGMPHIAYFDVDREALKMAVQLAN